MTTNPRNNTDYAAKQPEFRRLNSVCPPVLCGDLLFPSWVYSNKARLISTIQIHEMCWTTCNLILNFCATPRLFRRLNRYQLHPDKRPLKPPLFRRLNLTLNPAPCGVQSFWAPEKFWQVSPIFQSYNKTFSTSGAGNFHALRSTP